MQSRIDRRTFLASAGASLSLAGCGNPESEHAGSAQFEPTWESIRTHELPDWFHDAKLGIFVHWGLYSVPGWATPVGELGSIDWDKWFTNNPYAEWYLNSLRIDGSPTQEHHRKTYGADFDYMDFAPQFNEAVTAWDPSVMSSLFAEAGAQYVVLTTKHHDGFTLWPSEIDNPHLPPDRRSCSRDIVGELTAAVRGAGMRMGFYYSGGLDWSFNPEPIDRVEEVWTTILHTKEFADYADAHWRELIRRYDPAILWNDIGYPEQSDLATIVADFYNARADGVINNRFEIGREGAPRRHHDFETPEYAKMDEITDHKWETCRGPRLLFRLQPGGDRGAHDRGRRADSPAGRHCQQERESSPQFRPDGRRHHSGDPGQSAPGVGSLARNQWRGYLRHAALGASRRGDGGRNSGPVHVEGRGDLRHPPGPAGGAGVRTGSRSLRQHCRGRRARGKRGCNGHVCGWQALSRARKPLARWTRALPADQDQLIDLAARQRPALAHGFARGRRQDAYSQPAQVPHSGGFHAEVGTAVES